MLKKLLNGEVQDTLEKLHVEAWRKVYNRIRPHGSLNNRPLAPEGHVVGEFALVLVEC